MNPEQLRKRLQRLGVKKGRAGITAPPRKPESEISDFVPIESLVGGREVLTDSGAYFVAETAYALEPHHGQRALADVLRCSPHIAAHVSRDEAFASANLSRLAFLDIETTGLAGGAGTLAFLIGVGVVESEQFILRQFFLRDPDEEPALLSGVAELLKDRSGLITYNGRSFDVPIVQTRFTMARRRFSFDHLPHLDLLPPARRLWRGRYENCSLGTLEGAVLNVQRTGEDVPGWMIPQLYVEYLRSGDARQMRRVIYHNAEDILSMVTLAAHILETFGDPLSEARSGMDCLRLALWHDDLGHAAEADAAYRAALARIRSVPADQKPALYERYAAFLKASDRRDEALPLWKKWAASAPDNPEPCIELSKYYEWHARNIAEAQEWAGQALLCLSHWPKGWRRDEAWKEAQHRLERLKRKQTTDEGR